MPQSRSTAEIFKDIRLLCCEPGFLHALSAIVFRDSFLAVDLNGEVQHDEDHRYSRSRLNNNEVMLLVGLLVQSESSNVFETVGDTENLVSRADNLLEEFHTALEAPLRQLSQIQSQQENPKSSFGEIAKEAIYYGAESAYVFQYRQFARYRYRKDMIWLLSNKGISIRSIIDIADYLLHRVNSQTTLLMDDNYNVTKPPMAPEVSNALLVDKKSLIKEFGQKALAFLDAFSIPINNSNRSFDHPFGFNEANVRPILDLGQYVYIVNQFRLFESIYESPYYWMLADRDYKDTAANNRGKFLETTIAKMFQKVFGEEYVFSNVLIKRSKSEIAAEADVLVIYGEFVLVIQAKSKRLTMEARSGDTKKLKDDFGSAVQSAYDQANKFIDLLISGAQCEIGLNKSGKFEFLARAFPIVILSDHFPSLTFLTNHLIEVREKRYPAVLDIFFIDALQTLLNDPVEILYYLQQRTRFFDKVTTDSEFNLLGFHMKRKLYFGGEYDWVVVGQDFAADIDDYFIAKELGRSHKVEFVPLEERIGVAKMSEVISILKSGPPEVAGAAMELLDFSGDALQNIANTIDMVQGEVKAGKALKAFSIETHYGGISYVAVNKIDRESISSAEAIAHRHKYNLKKDRWYILLNCVSTPNLIDRVLPIWQKWFESKELERAAQEVDKLFRSTYIPFGTTKVSKENDVN